MDLKEFKENIERAKRRVMTFDEIEGYKDRHLKTILQALKTGLLRPESEAQFDAYYMLEDLLVIY